MLSTPLAALLPLKVQHILRFCNHDAPLPLRFFFSITLQQQPLDVLHINRPDLIGAGSILPPDSSTGFDFFKAFPALFLYSLSRYQSNPLWAFSMSAVLPPFRMSYRESYQPDVRGRAGPERDQYPRTTNPGSASSSRRSDMSLTLVLKDHSMRILTGREAWRSPARLYTYHRLPEVQGLGVLLQSSKSSMLPVPMHVSPLS